MKKTFAILLLIVTASFTVAISAPKYQKAGQVSIVSFDALANSGVVTLGANYNEYSWEIKWKALVAATPALTIVPCNASCSYALYGSLDGATWTSIKSSAAGTAGLTYVTGINLNYIKFVPAITPTTTAIATVVFKAQ